MGGRWVLTAVAAAVGISSLPQVLRQCGVVASLDVVEKSLDPEREEEEFCNIEEFVRLAKFLVRAERRQ